MVDTDGPESITHRGSNAKKEEKKEKEVAGINCCC